MNEQRRHILLQRREHLQTELASISQELNSLSLPSRLPAELLSEIFAYVGAYRPGQRTTHAVLRASHVCHRWREITLQSPHLWSHLLLGLKPEIHQLVIERSKDCALYVSSTAGRPYDLDSGLELLFDHMHRVASLEFSDMLGDHSITKLEYSLSLQRRSAPRLRFFSEASRAYLNSDEGLSLAPFSAPMIPGRSLLRLIDAACLQHVELGEVTNTVFDDLCRQPLSELKTLTLRGLNRGADDIDLARFGTVLSRSPCLERLDVQAHSVSWRPHTIVGNDIVLPQLSHVKVAMSLQAASSLFLSAHMPNLSRANAAIMAINPWEQFDREHIFDMVTAITDVLTAAWRRRQSSLMMLEITNLAHNYMLFSVSSIPLDSLASENNPDNRFLFDLPPDIDPVSLLRSCFAGQAIQSLTLAGSLRNDLMIDVLRECNSDMEHIAFGNTYFDLIVNTLCRGPQTLPSLRSISLSNCQPCHFALPVATPFPLEHPQQCACSQAWPNFLSWLRQRHAIGIPVGRVSMEGCALAYLPGRIAELQAVVAEVSII